MVRVRKGSGFHAFAVRACIMKRLSRVLSNWCRHAVTAGPLGAALAMLLLVATIVVLISTNRLIEKRYGAVFN